MEIKGIPDQIKRSDVTKLIQALGIEVKDLVALSLYYNTIQATVYARNEKGVVYLLDGTEKVATHEILIPVVEDDG